MSIQQKDDNYDIFLSKTLSWLLRHAATQEALIIGSDGFIDLNKIIASRPLLGKCSVEDIIRVVESNSKQRFTIRTNPTTNCLQIRANQGHSLKTVTNLELVPLTTVPDKVIHGTYFKSWSKIKKEGLSRMSRQHIHFATGVPSDKTVLSGIRANCEILIYIDLRKALEDGISFFKSTNNVILSGGNARGILKPKYFLKVVNARTGFPKEAPLSHVYSFLLNYGKIHRFRSEGNSFHVLYDWREFSRISGVLLTTSMYFGAFRISVEINSSDTPRQGRPVPPTSVDVLSPERLSLILKQQSSVDAQLNILLYELRIAPSFMQKNGGHLCSDLEIVLNSVFPNCRALPFGSTVTSLAFKGSDLDVFIRVLNPPPNLPNESTAAKCVRIAKKSLRSRPDLFTRVIPIEQAKTPIIKCIHKPTGMECDINFKNLLGVCNTALINYLLSSGGLILKTTIIIIKYWAKVTNCSGPGRFSNYSLVMLFIFYLQQLEGPLLPPVYYLQSPQFTNIVDGWNVSYNYNFNFSNYSNYKSIPELLYNFFKFYATFEFALKIISPYTGNAILKSDFVQMSSSSDLFKTYNRKIETENIPPLRIDTCSCVQDPFEHNHNLTSTLSPKWLQHFQNCCATAAQICNTVMSTGGEMYLHLLSNLILQKPKIRNPVTSRNIQILISAGSFLQNKNCAQSTNASNSVNENNLRQIWLDNINEYLLLLLTKVLKFETNIVRKTDEPTSKDSKREGQSDVHDDFIDKYEIECVSRHNVFMKRKQSSKQIVKTGDKLIDETAISDYILEKFSKVQNPPPIFVKIKIEVIARKKPTRVILNLVNNENKLKANYMVCSSFMSNWLPKCLEKLAERNDHNNEIRLT